MDVKTMPWEELRKWIRLWAPEIRRLAERGDELAQRAYNILCEMFYKQLPLTHPLHTELRSVLHDYLHRDLTLSNRVELGGKFGHMVPEELKDSSPRIVVPSDITKH